MITKSLALKTINTINSTHLYQRAQTKYSTKNNTQRLKIMLKILNSMLIKLMIFNKTKSISTKSTLENLEIFKRGSNKFNRFSYIISKRERI